MLASSDFKDLLRLLEKHNARYLVIGGYAVMKYSEPRYTKDLDLLISTDRENAEAVYNALKEFGAPLENLSADDFTNKDYFYQMGRAPLRIDVLMSAAGVEFEQAWKNRTEVDIEDCKIIFISLTDLISAKEASGRPQDLIDLKKLKKVLDKNNNAKKKKK
jgi:predicted nucleotidyltransferase